MSGSAALAGLFSFVICLVSGFPVAGGFLLFVGLAVAGCGFAFPPPQRNRSQGSSLSVGTIVACVAGVGLFIAVMLLARGGIFAPQPGTPRAEVMGRLLMSLFGLLLLAGAMIGFVYLVVRFGFSRPASAYYSLSAIALALAWGMSAPKITPRDDLPRTAQEIQRPPVSPSSLPNLGSARSIRPGVDFREVRLPVARDEPGYASKLYIYVPKGHHPPKSLPCIFIAPAGAIAFAGMELGSEDQSEHIPYAAAGFVVVAYEIDGNIPDTDTATDAEILQAAQRYWAAGAGIVNARNAIDFALAKIPEVDPSRLFTAGHSSAGVQSLLLAENDSRIKGCIAYAPVVDLELRVSDVLPLYRCAIKDFDVLLKLASPRAGESRLHCPVFLFHALDDDVVPVSESTGLADRLQRDGRSVELKTASSGGHYDSMISQGIPSGITWLKRISGLESSPTSPRTAPDVNDLADARSTTKGVGGTSVNPFEESPAASDTRNNAAEKIKELMASGKRPSAEEVREIIEGAKKNQAEGAKESNNVNAIDENPFKENSNADAMDENPFAESPFQPSGTGRSSSSRAKTAGPANNGTSTESSRGNAGAKQVQQLINQISGDNGFEKRDALKELTKIDPPAEAEDETRQAVIKVLNDAAIDEDHFTQQEAIETLGKWGDKSSVDVLLSLLADRRSRSLNKELYRALGQLKDARSAMPVAERLGDFFDRDAAEACLREMGSIAEDALLIVARSSDGEISLRAVRVLGDVGTEKCLPTLREGLRSRNPAVKEASKMALRKVRLRQNSTEEEEEKE